MYTVLNFPGYASHLIDGGGLRMSSHQYQWCTPADNIISLIIDVISKLHIIYLEMGTESVSQGQRSRGMEVKSFAYSHIE